MTVVDFLLKVNTPKLTVPETLTPTWKGRDWTIPFFGRNPVYTVVVAIIPAILATILIFMDQQITAVIVNRKEHKLNVSLNKTYLRLRQHMQPFYILLLLLPQRKTRFENILKQNLAKLYIYMCIPHRQLMLSKWKPTSWKPIGGFSLIA